MELDQIRLEFDKATENFLVELSKLRTGRANPAMIEDLKLDYYGTQMIVKQLASISVPEPRQLVVQPWDKNALAPMEKAIRESNLGLNPTNEGDKLRITIPSLTEERRKDLAKVIGKLAEETRIKFRSTREDFMKTLKRQKESGEISEDIQFRTQDDLQKLLDKSNAKIKEIAEKKEKEIMTV